MGAYTVAANHVINEETLVTGESIKMDKLNNEELAN